MIKHIKASNILSFGPDGLDLELRPLNVLIGANGSGKSNLIELIDLISNTPNDLFRAFRRNGGANEWLWKKAMPWDYMDVEITAETHLKYIQKHKIVFFTEPEHLDIRAESIELFDSKEVEIPKMFYENYSDSYRMKIKSKSFDLQGINNDSSILDQLKDPGNYPLLAYLSDFYNEIHFYREWTFGRNTKFRKPQPSDLRNDRLEPDFSNLGLFLNRLRRDPKTKRGLIKHLQYLYDGISDFEINIVEGGYVQILFTEGDFSIPASRLSDGTLRYLCLLAILLDPKPPKLICLEEPELGLHPDILPHLTDLLVEASERTQLIVTTHSQMIVDSLSEQPESVLVCEKHNGQTKIERLSKEKLGPWLEEYSLGDIWSKGEIGGNRW